MSNVRLRAERLGEWPHPVTPNRQYNRFAVKWGSALDDLRREARLIGAREVVIAIDCRERDIRRSTEWLNDSVRVDFPGVRVTVPSRHGTLVYACDNYQGGGSGYLTGWQANVRAVTLTLESLRAVERYGAANQGQAYAGFKAITSGVAMGSGPARAPMFPTADEAARWLAEQAQVVGVTWQTHKLEGLTPPHPITAEDLLDDADATKAAYRALAHIAHPDKGGDPEQWGRVAAAREIIDEARR